MDRETADDIKRHFDVVAEGLRSEVGGLRTGVGDLRGEVGGLRTEVGDLRGEIGGVRSEIGSVWSEIGGLRSEIRSVDEKGDRRFNDLKRHFDVVGESLRSEIQDVKRHSDVVAESLHGEIRLVAEGVAGLDEKFTREFVTVREETREQIGEVKSLLRASYGDLDRRVQALERKPS